MALSRRSGRGDARARHAFTDWPAKGRAHAQRTLRIFHPLSFLLFPVLAVERLCVFATRGRCGEERRKFVVDADAGASKAPAAAQHRDRPGDRVLVVLFYAVTIAKLGPAVVNRPLMRPCATAHAPACKCAAATSLRRSALARPACSACPSLRCRFTAFCAATGYGGTTAGAKQRARGNAAREISVRFDANVAPGLAWRFAPETAANHAAHRRNRDRLFSSHEYVGSADTARAVFNVRPDSAGAYFDKIACFCFSEQKLGPHETLELPVCSSSIRR